MTPDQAEIVRIDRRTAELTQMVRDLLDIIALGGGAPTPFLRSEVERITKAVAPVENL